MSGELVGKQSKPFEPSSSWAAEDPLGHISSWYQSFCHRPCLGSRSRPHYRIGGPTNRHYDPPRRWASWQGLYRPRAYLSVNAVKLLELGPKSLQVPAMILAHTSKTTARKSPVVLAANLLQGIQTLARKNHTTVRLSYTTCTVG